MILPKTAIRARFMSARGQLAIVLKTKLAPLTMLLIACPMAAHAQFQSQYEHISGGNTIMAAPMRARVLVQAPSGDVLYLGADDMATLVQGFRLHKVSSTGTWLATYTFPGFGFDSDVAPLGMTLDFDGLHVIVVGRPPQDALALFKIRISDGALIWSTLVESNGNYDLLGPWDGAVIAPHPGSETFLVFANHFLETGAPAVRRKLAGFAVDTDGNLIWSRLYTEANIALFERLHTRPTDIAIFGNLAFVATETDDEVTSRVGVFRVNATTGDILNMRLYADPQGQKLFNPRIDVVSGDVRGIALNFDEFEGPPWVAMTAPNGVVLWSQRLTSAATNGGIFRNSLLLDRLDTFIGEDDKAGIVSFDVATGAILDEHYFDHFEGDEDIVSMDRSQDESYLLSLEQRDQIDLVAAGHGYIYGDDNSDVDNTFTLVHTDTPADPFHCEIDHTTTVEHRELGRRNIRYVNDDWAQVGDFENSMFENTTMSETPCL